MGSFLIFAGGAIQLVPDGTLLIHLILIVVMVALLNATLLGPVNRILAERDRRTKGGSEEAQQVLRRVTERMVEHEQLLRQTRADGYSRLQQERDTAASERNRRIAEVKAEVSSLIDEEKQKIASDVAEARTTIGTVAEARASDISARIIGRPLSERQGR